MNVAADLLIPLLTSNSLEARHFRANIRAFNSVLSFVSFATSRGRGMAKVGRGNIIIHGAAYHYIGPLHPPGDTAPQ